MKDRRGCFVCSGLQIERQLLQDDLSLVFEREDGERTTSTRRGIDRLL